jgi:two-component system, NtrC family, nitrogen regulation sensor histidine kinase NtrY
MVFKRYQFQIILRLLLITATCFGITYVWSLHKYYFTLVNLILFLVLQLYWLFRFLTKWQQDMKVFAASVKHGDYNITYNLADKNQEYFELYDVLNHVARYVREIKNESVQQNQYFEYVVENAQVGLMAYNEKGDLLLTNQQGLRLLGQTQLKNINDIARFDRFLFEEITDLKLNQPKLIISKRDSQLKLSVRKSKFIVDESSVYLLSILNIRQELDENELRSWQELISVLTHEIMNSITPIHSLNGSMAKYLDKISGNEEIVAKAKSNLEVINRRSESLMTFVDRYRKISTVPLPVFQEIEVAQLLKNVTELLQEDLKDVKLTIKAGYEIISVDVPQIEQVLINILKNAKHAMEEKEFQELVVTVTSRENETRVAISDNGKGIPSDVMDKIFIPFFTTRKEGSGIGLTLSRQIMHRHGGNVEVTSNPYGTTITLLFRS